MLLKTLFMDGQLHRVLKSSTTKSPNDGSINHHTEHQLKKSFRAWFFGSICTAKNRKIASVAKAGALTIRCRIVPSNLADETDLVC